MSFSECYSMAYGHWGALDGRNDWNTRDAAVVCGLPYMDNVWPIRMYFALVGVEDHHDWLGSAACTSLCKTMQHRHLSTAIIQAFNRVRCRNMIDADGNCEPTDLYAFLPKGETGDAVLNAILNAMPDLVVREWDFTMDDAKAVRKSSSHERIVALMANSEGSVDLHWIAGQIGLKAAGLKELRRVLRQATHPLTVALRELGYTFTTKGNTRAMKAMLVRA